MFSHPYVMSRSIRYVLLEDHESSSCLYKKLPDPILALTQAMKIKGMLTNIAVIKHRQPLLPLRSSGTIPPGNS